MLDFKMIRTLRDEDEYQAALKEVRPYFDSEPAAGGAEAENFDALFLLIEDYEEKNCPFPALAEPAAVIKHVMAANSYSQADLVEVIGSKARASELLNGKREINLDQIRKLSQAWAIPVADLVGTASSDQHRPREQARSRR